MQEQAKISRVIISDATPTTKSEPAQVPHNNHNNSSNDTEGKPACDNSDDIGIINRNSNRSCNTHPLKPSDFGANNNGKFVYDPGGHTPNSEDGSTRDVNDSAYGTTATNTHRSCDRDRDKTIASPSDADVVSPIDFAQATCPVLDITSQPSTDSRCADTMPRLCSRQCPVHTFAFDSAPCTTADTYCSHNSNPASTIPTASLATAAIVTAACAPSTSCPDFGVDTSPRFSNDSIGTATNINLNSNGNPNNAASTVDSTRSTNADANIKSSSSDMSRAADTLPTDVHRTDALTPSFKVTDDDEDFAQRVGSHRDRRLHAQYRTGEFDTADIDIKRSNGKSIPGNDADIADITDITCTFNADAVTSSNNNSNDVTSIVNASRFLSTNVADSNSNSKLSDIPNISSTDATPHIRAAPSTFTHDNEPEHECLRILPLVVSHQVPPLASPPLDKPEEPPPDPPKNATPTAPTCRSCKTLAPSVSTPCTPPPYARRRVHLFQRHSTPFHIASGRFQPQKAPSTG